MKTWSLFLVVMLAFGSLLGACQKTPTPVPVTLAPVELTPTPATEEPTAEAGAPATPVATATLADEPIYLAIIWHQHQPVYFKDPETGIYAKPWVRLHAAKDYVDMAAMLADYPDIHVTFNLTPSLIRQLDDLAAGAKDLYQVLTEIPAAELTEEQKTLIMQRFWDINPKIIDRFPGYKALLDLRLSAGSLEEAVAAFNTQNFLDLQVLFNLGWTDPDWLAEEPLASLVAREQNYSEEHKSLILQAHADLIQQVVPIHRQLQDGGQIEVTMTPYAHPILPLLVDTTLAKQAMPDAAMPRHTFQEIKDAQAQVSLGVEFYQEHFGRAPRGMWPAEGAVAQYIVGMVADNGLQWMASDEGVLAASLGMTGFGRDLKETVNEADVLYRPYAVQSRSGPLVAMVFRDIVISDKVGFTYSGLSGNAAATDFVNRVLAAREQLIEQGAAGPHLVTVILDGENAWEHYDNDGKEFLNQLYEKLSAEPLIQTVTPSEYLAMSPELPKIDDLWAGSWISHSFSTWIGEDEENQAWDALYEVREILSRYEKSGQLPEETLAAARDLMYIAEGSDWFWWYGADQNSGVDEDFDTQYRATLKQVLLTLGEPLPDFLDVPIIPQQTQAPEAGQSAVLAPTVDGQIEPGEWDAAGSFISAGGAMASSQDVIEQVAYGYGKSALYLRVDAKEDWATATASAERSLIGIYLSDGSGGAQFSHYGRPDTLLGFGAGGLVEATLASSELEGAAFWTADGDGNWAGGTPLIAAAGERSLEIALPYEMLSSVPSAGDSYTLRLVWSRGDAAGLADRQLIPAGGPGKVSVPDLGLVTNFMQVSDPAGDDHGPGSYLYPQDGVFTAGSYDLLDFGAGRDENGNLVFSARLNGPVDNPWGSSIGLSIQTLDIYIDQDGPASGSRMMLPGRNAAFSADFAWDLALWIEGWNYGIYRPGADGQPEKVAGDLLITPDPGQRKITVRVSEETLGAGAENWAYGVALLSQEGYPSSGVWRVRDVLPAAEQWRLGGAPSPDSTNHTRIMDYLLPADASPTQEEWLSDLEMVSTPQAELMVDDLAQVPMLKP